MTERIDILLVEDFKSTRKAEIKVLEKLGFDSIIEAEDGESAVEILGKNPGVGLIISDWNMPGMDGYELLTWVRSNAAVKHAPFIMATAQGERRQAEKARDAGVSGFITKPFGPAELKPVIEKALEWKPESAAAARPSPRPAQEKIRLRVAHIQITDHLALGVLDHMIQTGALVPRHFTLNTQCMPGWNPVRESLENGDADAAFVLAPIGMDLFGANLPVRLILFAHRSGSICIRNAGGQAETSLHEYLKGKIFLLPHILSVHHMLADRFLREIGLKLGPVGRPGTDVFYEVVPPVQMPEFMAENPEACGFVVAEPMGTKAIHDGLGQLMFLSGEMWENHPCCVVLMRQEFIDAHEDAAHEFTEMLVKAGRFIAASPDEAARIALGFLDPAKKLGLNRSLLESVLKEPKGVKMDDMLPDLEDLDKIQRYMASTMDIGGVVDLEKFADLRFARSAIGSRPGDRRPSVIHDSAAIVARMISRQMAGSADAAAPTFEAAEDETSVSFTISSDMRLADRIVAESRHFLNRMGFETFSEFKLVLRELLINAIEHGNKSRADKQVACAIAMRPNAVFKITVSDQGEGFDHKALDMSIPKDSKQIRNRGYAIINAFSKKIEFNDAGNQVSAYVKVHQETRFDVSDEGGWTVIRPSGDITAAVADKFRTLLDRHADQGRTRFRFDFEKVQDLDSVGLSSFLILHKMLSDKGPELEIINVNKDLNHFFRMTRLDRIYAIRTSSKGDA